LNHLNRWIGGPSLDSEEKNPCSCRESTSDCAVCIQSNTILTELCDDDDDDDDDDDGDNNNEVFLFTKILAGSEERAYEKCGLTQTRKSTCMNHTQ
jgi:hypothetical protein